MTSARVLVRAVGDVPVLPPGEWRAALHAALRSGARPITMYGRAGDGGVIVTAVVEDARSEMDILRTVVERDVGYHALTPEIPAMHCFERELHEQHGVRVAGHPWLKPIRFEISGRAGQNAYPFYEIKGKEVHEVAVGPIHAGVIEPGSFRFMCLGEQVHHLEIHLGYQHRGVEQLLLGRDPRALAPLVETIAGDTSIAHTWAYSAAVEALAGIHVSSAIDAARAVMLELERIAMHLAGLAGMAGDLGFLQGASTYGRLRTTAINTSMRLSGSRFGRGAVRPAGLGAELGTTDDAARGPEGPLGLADLRKSLALLAVDVATINDCFLSARTVQHRLQGTGTLSPELASELGLVGLAARASGVARDLRAASGGIYGAHPIETSIEAGGDCWARACVRIREIDRSLAWIGSVVDAYPLWQRTRAKVSALAPRQLAVAMTEGWRGEVVHALETNDEGSLLHYKVQDPSMRNWLGLALAVRENEISDFPICNKSFDLSYCGNDL
jgi:Ni,Fe-hydrogenase III large subunit